MSFASGALNSLNQRASQDQRAWTEGESCPTSSRALCPERFVRAKPAPVQQGVEPIYHLEALETKQEEQSTSSKFCVCALGSIRAQCELSPMGRPGGTLESLLLVGQPLARQGPGGLLYGRRLPGRPGFGGGSLQAWKVVF